jgi:hypothetical protein
VLLARLEQRKSHSKRNETAATRKGCVYMIKQLMALGSALYYYQIDRSLCSDKAAGSYPFVSGRPHEGIVMILDSRGTYRRAFVR